jgi:hypothetical protein
VRLSAYERETIINFNEGEDTAYIFTYSKPWHRHLEGLGLKPTHDNGFGGKDCELPKKWVKLPRKPRRVSEQTKARLAAQGKALQSNLRSRKPVLQAKSEDGAVR